jgi:NADH-quinone oxidoreductase subunit J
MDANLIVFIILAVVAVGSALGMLFNRNAVYSALFLILNFATVAVFYLLLGAPFIAMTQVTVYAGAIMVLFLFVIMLLGAEHLANHDKIDWQMPVAGGLAGLLLFEAYWVIFKSDQALKWTVEVSSDFGAPAQIGKVLFSEYLLPFEITAFLLLAALVGAVIIARRNSDKPTRAEEEA